MKVDFATFCCAKDAHKLFAPGQLKKQVESNCYPFDKVILVFQRISSEDYNIPPLGIPIERASIVDEIHINKILVHFGVDISKPQYVSDIDKAHFWKFHVVNHLYAVLHSQADYIVFADNDCWMKEQPCLSFPELHSWVEVGIHILEDLRDIFIVSPNDGEAERKTQRMSQQMFLCRRTDFLRADFNQPGWDGDVRKLDTMPEYASMLEGRIHFYCKQNNLYRYVLAPEYRYWHHNRDNADGLFQTDYSKY